MDHHDLVSAQNIVKQVNPTVCLDHRVFDSPLIGNASYPTFLWGIPTLEKDVERRQVIRQTYLSFYKDSTTPQRICSLSKYTKGCQLAYAFFVGGNPQGPTELLEPNASFPMTVHTPSKAEDDMIYLNIKENQMDGKMTTWFKYASEFSDFDYIAKVDDDTMVFTPNFLEYMQEKLPRIPSRVYGGFTMDRNSCDPKEKSDHPCPLPLVGEVYMSGELSFMSRDLALYITNTTTLPNSRRKAITIGSHEDVSLSNYVFSIGQAVEIIDIPKDRVLRKWKLTAEPKFVDAPFEKSLWAHTSMYLGGYYKPIFQFRQTWREFLVYWCSGKTKIVSRCERCSTIEMAYFAQLTPYFATHGHADA
jgi:hypothetical protein